MMRNLDSRPLIGIGALLGLGWILVAFNTARAIQSNASLVSQLVGLAIPFALALTLFAGAVAILAYGLSEHAFRIACWAALGAIGGVAAVTLNIIVLPIVEPDFQLALYMITNAAAGGATIGLLIGLYDAYQKQLHQELAAKQEEANTLSQRLSVLNRALRHDTRNQAQIIQSHMELIDNRGNPPQEAVESIDQANSRLMKLSEEARQLEALLAGEDIETESIDIVATINQAIASVQEIYPSLTVESELPSEQLVVAQPMIKQAFKHILINVAEHSDTSDPRANISLSVKRESPPVAKLTIADNGPGIPEREAIRDSDHHESQLDHSSGMGLWLVSWTIDEAGGELEISSGTEEDVGTVVIIKLPVKADN